MDDSRRCTAKSKRSGQRCKKAACHGRTVCRSHGGASLRGADHPGFKHGRYSRALPHRLLRHFDELRRDPALISVRDEIALVDLRLQEKVEARKWGEVERLIETRRKLVSTEARIDAFRQSTMTKAEALTLVASLIAALRKHVRDPLVLEAVGREIELLLGG